VAEKVFSAAVPISGKKGIDASVCYRRSEFGVIRDNRPVARFPLAGEQDEQQIGKYATLDI